VTPEQYVGHRVRSFREAQRLTQGQLARKLGIPRPNVVRIEKGAHDPKLGTLVRIADALGTTVSTLVHGLELASTRREEVRRAG
jgi:transcriptional regulator with XRE-family HTH domain